MVSCARVRNSKTYKGTGDVFSMEEEEEEGTR
jgi:hypothetical protein